MMKVQRFIRVGVLCIVLALAGCDSGGGDEESARPTLGSPVAWATAPLATPALSWTSTPASTATSTPFTFPTFAATAVPPASLTPVVVIPTTAVPPATLTPAAVIPTTAAPLASLTPAAAIPTTAAPLASLTPADAVPTATAQASATPEAVAILPSNTAVMVTPAPMATLTNTPFQVATFAPPPSFTPFAVIPTTAALTASAIPPQPTATATLTPVPLQPTAAPTLTPVPPQPTSIPAQTFAPPPSFTPFVASTLTPLPAVPSAQVCPTCDQLRLRASPGTAGSIIGMLSAGLSLSIVGRTADNAWVQVVLADGRTGWVMTQYLVLNVDLNVVSITGTAQDQVVTGPDNIEIVSGITAHARQIFLDGRNRGNLAHAFTRVGDSISASPNFLFPIGYGSYSLGSYGYLGGAISFFSGPNGRGQNPFASWSMAAGNGWSTESVLNPANAAAGICAAGETPLACEYRVNKPAVALIMFGTNDSGGMPTETFRANLQTIVQTSINMGVIPVLSTIPPKHYNPATDGRVAEFNQVIIATARGYDVPLWNYWLAMRRLPGEGLAADGVHPSKPPDGQNGILDAAHLQYGYPTRNLTALQMLHTLWQQVLYDGDQAPAPTAQPPSGEQTPVPTAQPPSGGQTPGATPDTAACQNLPPPQLTVGGQGQVTPGLPNKVRSAAGTSATQVGSIPGEGVFQVIGGPACADGLWWWQVDYNGLTGWTANGDSSDYWVVPYPY